MDENQSDIATDLNAGPVETAVRRDVAALGELKGEFARTTVQVAMVLARAVDDSGADGPAAAVNWARELRMTLDQLRRDARERDDGDEDGAISTPVWDAPEPGAADAGPEGGGGGEAAG